MKARSSWRQGQGAERKAQAAAPGRGWGGLGPRDRRPETEDRSGGAAAPAPRPLTGLGLSVRPCRSSLPQRHPPPPRRGRRLSRASRSPGSPWGGRRVSSLRSPALMSPHGVCGAPEPSGSSEREGGGQREPSSAPGTPPGAGPAHPPRAGRGAAQPAFPVLPRDRALLPAAAAAPPLALPHSVIRPHRSPKSKHCQAVYILRSLAPASSPSHPIALPLQRTLFIGFFAFYWPVLVPSPPLQGLRFIVRFRKFPFC